MTHHSFDRSVAATELRVAARDAEGSPYGHKGIRPHAYAVRWEEVVPHEATKIGLVVEPIEPLAVSDVQIVEEREQWPHGLAC